MMKKKIKEMRRSSRDEDIHGGSAEDQQIEVSLDSSSIDLSLPQKGMAMDRQLLSDAENSEVSARIRTQEEGEEEGEEISNQRDFSTQKEKDAEENSEVSTRICRTWDKEGEEGIKRSANKKNVDGFFSGSGSFDVLAQSVGRGGINDQRGTLLHKLKSSDKFLSKADNSEAPSRIGEEGVEAINERGFPAEKEKNVNGVLSKAENSEALIRIPDEKGEVVSNQRDSLAQISGNSEVSSQTLEGVRNQRSLFTQKEDKVTGFLLETDNSKVPARSLEEEGEGRTNQSYPLHHCKRGTRVDAKSDMNVNQQTVLVYDTHENAPTECSEPLSPPLKGSDEGSFFALLDHRHKLLHYCDIFMLN